MCQRNSCWTFLCWRTRKLPFELSRQGFRPLRAMVFDGMVIGFQEARDNPRPHELRSDG